MPDLRRHKSAKRGVTLLEVMLAGSITALLVMSLLESLIVGAKIANENSQFLAADAYAFDVAWRLCNVSYSSLAIRTAATAAANPYHINTNNVPVLSSPIWPDPLCYVSVTNALVGSGKIITVDVEWGPAGQRKRLSQNHKTELFKSQVERGS